ncbi:MAG: endonuclease NucS domain-containing protein [Promethearchaeota archaeon]
MFFLDEDETLTEKKIQFLYQTHPYLIEKQFLNQKTIPQYPLPSGFADIVVFLEKEIIVIELKIDPLKVKHLLQLNEYLEDFKKEIDNNIKIRGILIGKKPKTDFKKSIKNLKFEVKIIVLNKEIPTKVKICKNCRLVNNTMNSNCEYCHNDEFL